MDLQGATVGDGRQRRVEPAERFELDEHFWRVRRPLPLRGSLHRADARERDPAGASIPTREEHLVDGRGQLLAAPRREGAGSTDADLAQGARSRHALLAALVAQVLGLGRDALHAADPRSGLGADDRAQARAAVGHLRGRRLVVAGQRRAERDPRVGDDQRRARRGRRAAARRTSGWCARGGAGRTAKSTKETHWLRVSGADQVERAMFLVPERDRAGVEAALARQAKRIAPTGFRRFDGRHARGCACVDVRRERYAGPVYSLEVPGLPHGRDQRWSWCPQCFPKDVTALKQLAGNSGYHFQLLNAVIEVNELQKRRVIAKLQKHLGSLVGQGDRAARARVQAEHRRHARGVVPRALVAAAGRRRARAGL